MYDAQVILDAHRQRLEDAGVIKANHPAPIPNPLFGFNPPAQNRVQRLRLRLVALTSLLTR